MCYYYLHVSVFQMSYTTVFGAYSAWLFIRTGMYELYLSQSYKE